MASLVLCSGGVKSALLVCLARREEEVLDNLHVLFVDHGQACVEGERQSAHRIADYYHGRYHELAVLQRTKGEWKPFVLSAILMHALIYAKEHGIRYTYYGACKSHEGREWQLPALKRIQNLADFVQQEWDPSLRADFIQVGAPLIALTRKKIYLYAKKMGVPLDLTWSCEVSNTLTQCGHCPSCEFRKEMRYYDIVH